MLPFRDHVMPVPSPDFTPEEVVKIQLDALQNNDLMPKDQGIRAAYGFTSPSNQLQTGPLERFIALIKSPAYRSLLGFERAQLSRMLLKREVVFFQVRVFIKDGMVRYEFVLSRQQHGPHTGCWLTDAVIRYT